MADKTKLQNVRLSFPALFTPEAFKPGDAPTFKATFLVPKGSDMDKVINEAILKAAEAKWPGKGAAIVKAARGNPNKFCYQDGDNKSYDGYQGMMAFSAKSKVRPLVIDADQTPLTEQDGKPYAGCYVNASVEIFGYENSGNGISAQLRGVQFLRDGDSFSGAGAASVDEFEDLSAEGLV